MQIVLLSDRCKLMLPNQQNIKKNRYHQTLKMYVDDIILTFDVVMDELVAIQITK